MEATNRTGQQAGGDALEEGSFDDGVEAEFTLPEIASLFYRVSSVIPEEQEIRSISPTTNVSEALKIMREGDFSQLPVVAGDRVLGVFSYRSALEHLGSAPPEGNIEARDVPIEELTEQPVWVRAHDELIDVVGEFEHVDALLVGGEADLQGIVTAVDVARFYLRVAQPFILLGEIERTLRSLVRASIDAEALAEQARLILAEMYEEREGEPPTTVEEMTTGELVQLVRDGRFWPLLEGALGVRRENASAKLRPIPSLRNDVFHFRRPLDGEELQSLRDARDWLLRLRLAAEAGE